MMQEVAGAVDWCKLMFRHSRKCYEDCDACGKVHLLLQFPFCIVIILLQGCRGNLLGGLQSLLYIRRQGQKSHTAL